MTPNKQAQAVGLDSLRQVSELTGQDVEKLRRWSKDRPQLFKIVLFGCVKVIEYQQQPK